MIYTCAFLGTIHELVKGRTISVLVCYGIACSLKPQAIFLAPFLGGLFVKRRLPWRHILMPLWVYLLCGMPAILAGRDFIEILFHYGHVKNIPGLTLGATNWYQWLPISESAVIELGGWVLGVLAAAIIILKMQRKTALAPVPWMISTALLSCATLPFVLPGMHERYFFSADALSVLYAALIPNGWRIMALIQACSLGAYMPYLFNVTPIPMPWLAALMAAVILILLRKYVDDTGP
jgi:Gpi18-like mannosyltransferase